MTQVYPVSMICTFLYSVIIVYWFFLVTGTTFTLMAMIGILILIGVVRVAHYQKLAALGTISGLSRSVLCM